MRSRLNRPQQIVVAVALAVVTYLVGIYITTKGHPSEAGWFAYAPNSEVVFQAGRGMSAHASLAAWIGLTLGWLGAALWLFGSTTPPDSK